MSEAFFCPTFILLGFDYFSFDQVFIFTEETIALHGMKLGNILLPGSILLVLLAGVYLAGKLPELYGSGSPASTQALAPSPEGLEAALAQRKSEADTLPISDELLLEVLPTEIAGFTLKDENKGTFHGKRTAYAEARRIFANEQGQVISISLADCSAAPIGLEHTYRHYFEQGTTDEEWTALAESVTAEGLFVHLRNPAPSSETRLEAGICYRFLLLIQLEGTTETNLLKNTFRQIDWDRLTTHCSPTNRQSAAVLP